MCSSSSTWNREMRLTMKNYLMLALTLNHFKNRSMQKVCKNSRFRFQNQFHFRYRFYFPFVPVFLFSPYIFDFLKNCYTKTQIGTISIVFTLFSIDVLLYYYYHCDLWTLFNCIYDHGDWLQMHPFSSFRWTFAVFQVFFSSSKWPQQKKKPFFT